MITILSLVVCLSANPQVCETVTPDYVRAETGEPLTLFECLGIGGQVVAQTWLSEHPEYFLRRIQCSVANDGEKLRDQIESPEA